MISPIGQRSPFPGTAGYSHAPNAALLIDFDNVTMGIRSDLGKELKALLNSDVIRGKVAVQRAYADWRRYPQYIVPLAESSIDLIFAPAYGSSKKNATDLRMAIDAIELVFTRPEIGTFILMTGDSDFSSCVLKLKEYGKYVIGVGMRESSSDLLIQNCDEYYSYHSLSGLTRTGEVQESTEDPWVLVRRAAEQMEANGDVMRTDRLKQVMLDLDPAFDEKKLGYSKFSRFVQEAANKGIVRLRKGENGQYELVPSEEEEAEPEAAVAAETRRGRGREREPRRDGRREPSPRQEEVAAEAAAEKEPEAAEVPQPAAEAPAVEAGRETAIPEDGTGIEQAYALLQAALRELTSSGAKAVRDGDVKRKMLDLSPGFDEAGLGFSKFTRFLRQAHDAEVIDLQRSNGGNYEVALPASGKRLPPPKSVSATPARPTEAARPAAEAPPEKGEKKAVVEKKVEVKAEQPDPTPAAVEAAKVGAAAETPAVASRTVGVGALRGRRPGRPGALVAPPPILPGQVVAPATRLAAEQAAAVAEAPSPDATAAAPAAEAGEAAPAAEEARKKSRRGRRGRGRGRGAEAAASAEAPQAVDDAPQSEGRGRAGKPAREKPAAAAAKTEPAPEAARETSAAEAPKRTPPPEGPIDKITARARRARALRGDADEAVAGPPILPGQAKPAPASPVAVEQVAGEKEQTVEAQPARKARGRGRGRKAAEQAQPAAAQAAVFSGLPTGREGIIAHLSAYRGVGAKTAEALFDRFGERTFEALQNQADEVREAIGPRRAGVVLEQWKADVAGRGAGGGAEQKGAPEARAESAEPAEAAKASANERTGTRRSSGRSGSRTTAEKAATAPRAASKAASSAKASASSRAATKASPKRGEGSSRGGGRRKKETTPSS